MLRKESLTRLTQTASKSYLHPIPNNPAKHLDPSNSLRPCIAILDDNSDIRLIVRVILEPNYVVIDFEGADALLNFLGRNSCDLIVSDLSLPHMDGFDFIAALRKNPRLASIPVVAFTASGSLEIRERAMAAGFAAYLDKMASLDELLSVVARNLRAGLDTEIVVKVDQASLLLFRAGRWAYWADWAAFIERAYCGWPPAL